MLDQLSVKCLNMLEKYFQKRESVMKLIAVDIELSVELFRKFVWIPDVKIRNIYNLI